MWLESGVAVAVVYTGGCSSDSTLAWELPYAVGTALKKKKDFSIKSSPNICLCLSIQRVGSLLGCIEDAEYSLKVGLDWS